MTDAIRVLPEPGGFGASITGVDLRRQSRSQTDQVRHAWLQHGVISFPDQPMSHTDLERFARTMGALGDNPFVKAVDGHPHVLEVRREPDEQPPPFGGAWHSDWSFQPQPPSASILHAKIVPPVGGETWFADGCGAYEGLDRDTRSMVDELVAIHSARRPYSPAGALAGGSHERSMTILPSDEAYATTRHPLVRVHPETGRRVLWLSRVYVIGLEGMSDRDSARLLQVLHDHGVAERYLYRQRWQPDMLVMWDNRRVQHCARGGYSGHQRIMHRTTVAGDTPIGVTPQREPLVADQTARHCSSVNGGSPSG